ncbi:MAG: hypothetical protein A3F46_09140 [Legionellales bacterium RIFCSPHIGHO2_12_FULL_42_9]|nr:MAG: hypothetical protein A3F46_09140 [Legionellales bacterium RIFCSPHIGHO2_12_FULL_42_9]
MDLLDIVSSLFALILLEIILGVDNLVFLSILTEKLPKGQRKSARHWGLTFAWLTRLALLVSAFYLTQLKNPLFSLYEHAFSVRDLFLLLGGVFLIAKATQEIRNEVIDVANDTVVASAKLASFGVIVFQVGVMDIIFSFDSVLTAVGLTNQFWIMATAITCAIWVMIYASEPVSQFIEKYPTIKMLALSFLILIGTVLMADGFSFHIPRGYIYLTMAFSLSVEALNLLRHHRHRRK